MNSKLGNYNPRQAKRQAIITSLKSTKSFHQWREMFSQQNQADHSVCVCKMFGLLVKNRRCCAWHLILPQAKYKVQL